MMDWRTRSAETVDAAVPARFKAPLFYSIVNRLDVDRRCVVLDLGAASTPTINLFSQFRCRLDIADLGESVHRLDDRTPIEELAATAEDLLPRRQAEATDIVLCWDMLNYLTRPALRAVMARVAERSKPGAQVHALIAYSQPTMRARPGQYVPLPDDCLVDTAPPGEAVPAPRYSPDDLLRSMPDYGIERAMLLRNGMQEFLFQLRRPGHR